MVLKLPKEANLDSYRALCSDDAEQDFFSNIVHLQTHMRVRALSCFSNIISSRNLSKVVTYKEKLLLRVIYAILDHFHFEESLLKHEATVSTYGAPDPYGTDMKSSSTLIRITDCGELIQQSLHKNIFPKIQKLLVSDSGKINVNIILAALELLKLLPSDIIDSELPIVVHRISIFLKNRLESVRDEARAALSACLKELGFQYLQFIIHVLK
ncbi:hypothetical protein OROMI_016907 [Orobanche minor]